MTSETATIHISRGEEPVELRSREMARRGEERLAELEPLEADVAKSPFVRGDVGVGRAVRRAEDPSLFGAVDLLLQIGSSSVSGMNRSKTIRVASGGERGLAFTARRPRRQVGDVAAVGVHELEHELSSVSSAKTIRRPSGNQSGKRASPSTWVI